ncbi:16S ribosomal RNA methyltransferase RsmE [Melioribacter roseus P3M-2]|uniref:Ribosomal RNA small subunit methyltransferase E n=1 Tax=Melioribacter roseus (strain DSM 23840 / JCM 17771 / VKM B-2668 / P3M-2) TaxID=1191523 RepID=I6Z968_MELRP|nr:RsmE family RNA methyltransferase [Melioribacter roseus]AFN75690.1 16S ribosomal RNA methyltransferase RsmE [Melioribacter roseus P3M-2]
MSDSFLSEIELYYSDAIEGTKTIVLSREESHHLTKVMRHNTGDEIYVTDGKGNIYRTVIFDISKREVKTEIKQIYSYPDKFKNITFCLPRLKNAERFEAALEKSIELGITNFIVFESKRTVARGEKLNRWNKIALAAMKQSLRSWKPVVGYAENLHEISFNGEIIIFEQKGNDTLTEYLNNNYDSNKNYFFIFGPEGGFESSEIEAFENASLLKLTENRLRSETAVIAAAALLATLIR